METHNVLILLTHIDVLEGCIHDVQVLHVDVDDLLELVVLDDDDAIALRQQHQQGLIGVARHPTMIQEFVLLFHLQRYQLIMLLLQLLLLEEDLPNSQIVVAG